MSEKKRPYPDIKRRTKKPKRGIYADQAGYYPDSVKTAAFPFPADKFTVVDKKGKVCFEGTPSHHGTDNISVDDVYTADFSALRDPGTYRVCADGVFSQPFRIGNDICRGILRDISKAYYYLRCGCDLDEKYAGRYSHKACHTGKALIYGSAELIETRGGWHDAGDYGRYVTSGCVACAQLLRAYKMFPEVFDGLMLNIPESASRIPDIISEVRYELEWLLKVQRPDGSVCHKVTTVRHAPFIMPEYDNEQLIAFPASSMAAADLTAVCAFASGIYRKFDEAFADRLRAAAELSYDWLEKNPEFLSFSNPFGCDTGSYNEESDIDNRLWSAAEMYALTGGKKYHDDFTRLLGSPYFEQNKYILTALGYYHVGGLGTLAYIFCDAPGKDESLSERLGKLFIGEAGWLAEKADRNGYRAAMEQRGYFWGSNMILMLNGIKFVIAYILTGDDTFMAYAEDQLHVLLGRNALGISYITGIGTYRCSHPHYRPSEADGIEETVPGFVIGGPNRYLNDPAAKEFLSESTPPMKCYVDNVLCYSLNEITIYWNSPAVFVTAAICSKHGET